MTASLMSNATIGLAEEKSYVDYAMGKTEAGYGIANFVK
jgi:hypothetical protein